MKGFSPMGRSQAGILSVGLYDRLEKGTSGPNRCRPEEK